MFLEPTRAHVNFNNIVKYRESNFDYSRFLTTFTHVNVAELVVCQQCYLFVVDTTTFCPNSMEIDEL